MMNAMKNEYFIRTQSNLQLNQSFFYNIKMNQNPANLQNPQQPIEQPKKKVKQTYTLKPEHFQKQNGLQALYKAIQKVDFTGGQDNIQASMKKIMILLKTWHFQMLPRYSFELFLERCKKLGNHKFTQAYMTKVRRIHKNQDNWGIQGEIQTEPLNNVNLDHLNPTQQNQGLNSQEQTMQKKIQRALKLVNQFQGRGQEKIDEQIRKMQIQRAPNNRQKQIQQDQSDGDDCQELFRQMDALQKQKKQLFSKQKQQTNVVQKPISNANQQSEQPYIPEGFDQIDYAQESSYNNQD